ncbi:MAG TPA: endonuclease/exonuclease/phosphatase family protein [Candidatus Coprenecus pullistercoris]|nr:endonuclease/exonuclease/phosphatase family protein [Candidatus Coprenecus pullistercoris]
MRRFFLFLLYMTAALAAAFILFIAVAALTDYRPEARVPLEDLSGMQADSSGGMPDSLSILCWNIGYGGLGDDMDFFYDGGTQVRTSRERTLANLDGIISEIRHQNADIVLLQEVDECSRRTYRINEVEMLRKAFPEYHIYLAYNYKSFFVPIPFKAPMGKVASGVVLMSRIAPTEVSRMQYPSRFPWPVSMFNLKRCLLSASFRLADGSTLIIGNTHNTAYDTGDMRSVETEFLGELAAGLHSDSTDFIIGGDWNQYPASYNPSERENSNPHFSTVRLEEEKLLPYGRIIFDRDVRTLRHLDKPYSPESVLTVTDYFYVSPGIRIDTVRALDLKFKYSDHQPVLLEISEIH